MLLKLLFKPPLRAVINCVKFSKAVIFKDHLQVKFEDKAFAEQVYNKNIEDVKAYVPSDKLLIYDVSEGWPPLCKFLNVPEPDETILHLNKKENFKVMLGELIKGKMV